MGVSSEMIANRYTYVLRAKVRRISSPPAQVHTIHSSPMNLHDILGPMVYITKYCYDKDLNLSLPAAVLWRANLNTVCHEEQD